jgi:hypothetical protein
MAPDAAVPTPGSRRAITTKPRTTPPLPDPIASAPVVPAASVIQELTPAPPARPEPPASAQPVGPTAPALGVDRGRSRAGESPARREDRPEPIATAVYVTGTTNLEPGRRYGIAIHGSRLQVLGPIDLDDRRIALERQVEALEARAIEGRFIMSDQRGWVVAFMAVGGIKPAELAELVAEAATDASLRSSQVVPLRQEG